MPTWLLPWISNLGASKFTAQTIDYERVDMSAPRIARWLLVVGIAILALYWYPTSWFASGFITSLYSALGAALIAISITVLLIDNANEQRGKQELKKRLIREMGSFDQGFAVRAAKELKASGWLTDGSLEGADLTLANLAQAQLAGAYLQKVLLVKSSLTETDLQGADLRYANLERTVAEGLKASRAQMGGATLHRAQLPGANLDEVEGTDDGSAVDMLGASLIRASLRGAKLEGARLEDGDFLEVDFTGSDLTRATLLRANMSRAILDDVNLERADLSELRGWQTIASLRNARIDGVRNAPAGFIEWAMAQGARELTAGKESASETAAQE